MSSQLALPKGAAGTPVLPEPPTVATMTTVPAGTAGAVLLTANRQLCQPTEVLPKRPDGPFYPTDTNFVPVAGSKVTIRNANASLGVVSLLIDGPGAKSLDAEFVTGSKLTVPKGATRLTVAGRPAYYGMLCGTEALAWQWQSGSWAALIGGPGLTASIARQVAISLRASHSQSLRLPFTVGAYPAGVSSLVSVGPGVGAKSLTSDTIATILTDDQGNRLTLMFKKIGPGDPTSPAAGTRRSINGVAAQIDDQGVTLFVQGYTVAINDAMPNNEHWLAADQLVNFANKLTIARSMSDRSTWFPAGTATSPSG